jgi:hypothetical protein
MKLKEIICLAKKKNVKKKKIKENSFYFFKYKMNLLKILI